MEKIFYLHLNYLWLNNNKKLIWILIKMGIEEVLQAKHKMLFLQEPIRQITEISKKLKFTTSI